MLASPLHLNADAVRYKYAVPNLRNLQVGSAGVLVLIGVFKLPIRSQTTSEAASAIFNHHTTLFKLEKDSHKVSDTVRRLLQGCVLGFDKMVPTCKKRVAGLVFAE